MIALVRNGIVLAVEPVAPDVWADPETGARYGNFANLPMDEMVALGWRQVVDSPPEFDPRYEKLSAGPWEYDAEQDHVTRSYTATDRPVEDVRAERLAAVRAECNRLILSVISLEHQMDIALGIDPDLGYTDWIAAMRQESNRCEDLYMAAVDMTGMKAVVWAFPEYSGVQ